MFALLYTPALILGMWSDDGKELEDRGVVGWLVHAQQPFDLPAVRAAPDERRNLNVNPAFSMADFKAVAKEWRDKIPEYVKDYVPINQLM